MSAQLFQLVAQTNPRLHGWCTDQRALTIAALVYGARIQTTVVIGVAGGRDTIAPALACMETGVGKIIAIDPWLATASVEGQVAEADRKWWSDQKKHDQMYESFVLAMQQLGITPGIIDVRRQKSDDVEPPEEIGLLISDGNHGIQAIRDIKRFAPKVLLGGYAYLDDLNWAGGAVLESVGELEKLGFREIFKQDGGAWFQRIRAKGKISE